MDTRDLKVAGLAVFAFLVAGALAPGQQELWSHSGDAGEDYGDAVADVGTSTAMAFTTWPLERRAPTTWGRTPAASRSGPVRTVV